MNYGLTQSRKGIEMGPTKKNAAGQIEVAMSGSIVTYSNGLPFDTAGRLCVSNDTPAWFQNGIPLNASGYVCIGDGGPVPSFSQDFSNATALDPRITFSRSGEATYIKNGRLLTAGVDEPVFEDGGLRLWGSVTNLSTGTDNMIINSTPHASYYDIEPAGPIFEPSNNPFLAIKTDTGNPAFQRPIGGIYLEAGKGYTISLLVEFPQQVGELKIALYDWDLRVTIKDADLNLSTLQSSNSDLGVHEVFSVGPNGWPVYRIAYSATVPSDRDMCRFNTYLLDNVGTKMVVHHIQVEEGSVAGPMVLTGSQPETMPADNARIEGAAFSSIFNPNQGALVLPHSSFHMGGFSLNSVFVLAGPTYPMSTTMVTFKGPDGYLYLGGSNLPTQQIPNSDQDYVNLKLRWGSNGIDVFVGDTRVLSDTPLPTNWGEADRLILADELSAGKYIDRLAMLTEAPTDSNMEGM